MDKFFDDHEALLEARLREKFGDDMGRDIHGYVEEHFGLSTHRPKFVHCMRNMTDASLEVLRDMMDEKLEADERRAKVRATMPPVQVNAPSKRARRSKWKQPDGTVHVTTYVVVDHETQRLERVDASMDGACLVDATYAFNEAGQRIGKSQINSLHRPQRRRV